MKKIVICNRNTRHITDEDYDRLKRISPGLARLVKDSEVISPTHFVCENCGQIPPIKLRLLHECSNNTDI